MSYSTAAGGGALLATGGTVAVAAGTGSSMAIWLASVAGAVSAGCVLYRIATRKKRISMSPE